MLAFLDPGQGRCGYDILRTQFGQDVCMQTLGTQDVNRSCLEMCSYTKRHTAKRP